jgi:biopolymer transport protein ExbD
MSGSPTGGETQAEPNLTPLLDVVFQLITFFMLVFKISGDNFDQRVHLPVAGSARPVEGDATDHDRIVLNIASDGSLLWGGLVFDTERGIKKIQEQARLSQLNERISGNNKNFKPGDPLPTTIVLRVDKATPFRSIYRYITACQADGYTKFAWKAMNAEG